MLPLVLGLGLGFGGLESSRERTRRMIPRTARRVRPPGTPVVRGLVVELLLLCGLGSLWGFGGASMGSGGVAEVGVLGPWSHGGGGGGFGEGEKRGSGGGAMAGSVLCVCVSEIGRAHV